MYLDIHAHFDKETFISLINLGNQSEIVDMSDLMTDRQHESKIVFAPSSSVYNMGENHKRIIIVT